MSNENKNERVEETSEYGRLSEEEKQAFQERVYEGDFDDVYQGFLGRAAGMLFCQLHSEYEPTLESAQKITGWLQQHRLELTLPNMNAAYEDLVGRGQIKTLTAQEIRAKSGEVTLTRAQIAILNEVDRMEASDFTRRIHNDPAFARAWNEAEAARRSVGPDFGQSVPFKEHAEAVDREIAGRASRTAQLSDGRVITERDIDKMHSSEYRRLLKNPYDRAAIEKLLGG